MGYFQPGVATGCPVSFLVWLQGIQDGRCLDSHCPSRSISGNQSSQTLRLANWGLCLAGGEALSEIEKGTHTPIHHRGYGLFGRGRHTYGQQRWHSGYSPRQWEDYHKAPWLIAKWTIQIPGARIRLKRREDFLHLTVAELPRLPPDPPQHSLTHPKDCCWELEVPKDKYSLKQLLAVETGEMVDKYPNSLVLRVENSECYSFSPSPPKGLCASHSHLDKTLCISFLPCFLSPHSSNKYSLEPAPM